jgi:hypothetical protein
MLEHAEIGDVRGIHIGGKAPQDPFRMIDAPLSKQSSYDKEKQGIRHYQIAFVSPDIGQP